MGTRALRPLGVAVVSGALLLGAATGWAATGGLTANGDARRLTGDQTAAVREQLRGGTAKNVILLIGDGMGDSEITVARNYALGAAGRFAGIDALPLTGQYTTYALDKADGKPDYVTDSAASGSGWATGTKTYNGAISVDVAGTPQRTLLEIARANGLRTGDVSTAELQDATPAVLVSHVTDRGCYAPTVTTTKCPTNALQNGGLGSITEQLIGNRPDVTLGGGGASFNEAALAGPWAGKTLLQQAKDRGFQVVTDAAGLAGSHAGEPVHAGPRPVRSRQHGDPVGRSVGHAHRRHRAGGHLHAQPGLRRHLADAGRDDHEGHRPAPGRQEGLLPAGRGRQHRQAGPRGQPVRTDR